MRHALKRTAACAVVALLMLVSQSPANAADVATNVGLRTDAPTLTDGTKASVAAWMNIDYTNNVIRAYSRIAKNPAPYGVGTDLILVQDGYGVRSSGLDSSGTVAQASTQVHPCGGGHVFKSKNSYFVRDSNAYLNTGVLYSNTAESRCVR